MIKFNFSKATSFERNASAIKEIRDVLALSDMFINVAVFTSCKLKKCKNYPVILVN